MKRSFLWADRWFTVFSDRIEYFQQDRPHIPKTVVRIENISLSAIIRHHGSFEFTLTMGEARYMHRIRLRTNNLEETDRIHSIITKVRRWRESETAGQGPKRTRERRSSSARRGEKIEQSISASLRTEQSCFGQHGGPENPHFSINIMAAALIVFTTLIAPVLDSLFLTGTAAVLLGLSVAIIFRIYSVDVPTLHLFVSFTPPSQYQRATASSGHDQEYLNRNDRSRVGVTLDDLEVSSNSGNSSINEVGYSTPVPGSPERPRIDFGEGMNVLFSESSKFLSSLASRADHKACYSVMLSMGETVTHLIQSMPESLTPPPDLRFIIPTGLSIERNLRVVPDDPEFTRSEWTVIRNRNGLRVLTTKLSPSLTRWPVITSATTIKAHVDKVYRAIALPEIFKRVDEFGGDYCLIHHVELTNLISAESVDIINANSILKPENAPVLLKYQEMKSVWPVAPRDYLALQCGFLLESCDSRKGKFLIAKSTDPLPNDPYPEGHEGYVRGSLTASAFIFLENKTDPSLTDIWTFLHCDMRGNISGNGKIADFITQSQMPKFFAKLEAVAASLE